MEQAQETTILTSCVNSFLEFLSGDVTKRSCRGHRDSYTFYLNRSELETLLQRKCMELKRNASVKSATFNIHSTDIVLRASIWEFIRNHFSVKVTTNPTRWETVVLRGVVELFYGGFIQYYHHEGADDCACGVTSQRLSHCWTFWIN